MREPVSKPIADAASLDGAALLCLARKAEAEGHWEKAAGWLRRAAETGNIAAKAALGRHLVTFHPTAFEEGVALTLAAADGGNAEAAHLAAVLAAIGASRAQSWERAFDYLTRAAENGGAAAQAELALLAGTKATAQAPAWQELRAAIDVAAWLRPPPAVGLRTAPRAGLVKGFLAEPVCDWLIARARPRLTRAAIYDGASAAPRPDDSRTNSAMAFSPLDCDLVVAMVRARIAALIGLPPAALEESSVLHYRPGQHFAAHYDFLDASSPLHAKAIAVHGQRVMTVLIYLNADYDGGETDFPTAGWRFKGAKGDALLFWNILPNGQPDPLTRHAGLPPSAGEKWLFSQWVRCRLG